MTTDSTSTDSTTSHPAPREYRVHVVTASPLGPLTLVSDGQLIVGLYHEGHDPAPPPALLGVRLVTGVLSGPGEVVPDLDDAPGGLVLPQHGVDVLRRAITQVDEYFGGSRQSFELPIGTRGTPFQCRAWEALSEIPYGERRTYRDIAAHLGNPRMGRAIGAAIRANPLSIIVPGHRVVSRSGAVTGYAAGIEAKIALLDLEAGGRPPIPPEDPRPASGTSGSGQDQDADRYVDEGCPSPVAPGMRGFGAQARGDTIRAPRAQ